VHRSDEWDAQKARVVFSSISLQEPHILLFDEPTNHLDMQSIDALCDVLDTFLATSRSTCIGSEAQVCALRAWEAAPVRLAYNTPLCFAPSFFILMRYAPSMWRGAGAPGNCRVRPTQSCWVPAYSVLPGETYGTDDTSTRNASIEEACNQGGKRHAISLESLTIACIPVPTSHQSPIPYRTKSTPLS
jgi:hypothetical protein